ncbi:CPBP family glutamic-type intramembrane protease [Celeribacter sp. ULVN23_4]
MASVTDSGPQPAERQRLWLEFIGLFVSTPIVVAIYLPPSAMLLVLLLFTVVGLLLLHRTPDFHWRDLTVGWRQIEWRIVAFFALVTAAVSFAIVALVVPEAFLVLWRLNPVAWLVVMALYPVLSALPQEFLFRPLFFRRYASILPQGTAALFLNAGVFSLAHLLYWNWVVAAMTFAGGLAFAWAYQVKRSFPLAVALHAVAGNILFTVGTGMLFYTGTIERPF